MAPKPWVKNYFSSSGGILFLKKYFCFRVTLSLAHLTSRSSFLPLFSRIIGSGFVSSSRSSWNEGGDEEQLQYQRLFSTAGGNLSHQTNLDMIDRSIDSLFHIYFLAKIVSLTLVVQSTLNRFSLSRRPSRILKEMSTKYQNRQRTYPWEKCR